MCAKNTSHEAERSKSREETFTNTAKRGTDLHDIGKDFDQS